MWVIWGVNTVYMREHGIVIKRAFVPSKPQRQVFCEVILDLLK